MRKFIGCFSVLCSLLLVGNAFAADTDGYVCSADGDRTYVGCVSGWYLDSSSSTCIQCPAGLREGPADATSESECVAIVEPGYYLKQVNKFGNISYAKSDCPAGSYCPGGTFGANTYGNSARLCSQVDANTLQQIVFGAKYNSMHAQVIETDMLGSITSAAGASEYTKCYFEVPAGKHIKVASNSASYTDCEDGLMATTRRAYFDKDSIVSVQNCSSCEAGEYSADKKTCELCDIQGKLGLDDSVVVTLLDKTSANDSVCAYKLSNFPVENGSAKNIQCSMSYGSYTCYVYNDENNADLAGYIGCDAGNVMYDYSDTGISGPADDYPTIGGVSDQDIDGYYISFLEDLRCEPVKAGYVQSVTASDNLGWAENVSSLKGTMCVSGTFCPQGAKTPTPCPGKQSADGQTIAAESTLPATSIGNCYIPESPDVEYTDAIGNRYVLAVDCQYTGGAARCQDLDGTWNDDYNGYQVCLADESAWVAPTTQAECEAQGGASWMYEYEAEDGVCECTGVPSNPDQFQYVYDLETGNVICADLDSI